MYRLSIEELQEKKIEISEIQNEFIEASEAWITVFSNWVSFYKSSNEFIEILLKDNPNDARLLALYEKGKTDEAQYVNWLSEKQNEINF